MTLADIPAGLEFCRESGWNQTPGDWELRRELASVLLASGMESSPVSSRKSADTKRDLVRALTLVSR